MYNHIIIPILTNIYLYNNIYHSLFNCIILSICTLLKLIFFDNYFSNKLLEYGILTSIIYYIIDTLKIISKGKINAFVIHHICACELLLNKYIFNYNLYTFYLMVFLMELSSISYNLYYYKFINKQTHINIYSPLRIICNIIFIYYIIYENIYTYYFELLIESITYLLLFIFNIVAVYKTIK